MVSLSILWINLCSLPRRLGASLVIVIGVAGIVAVLSGLFSLVAGLELSMANSTHADRGVVLRDGSVLENTSYYTGTVVGRLRQLDEITVASGELLIYIRRPSLTTGELTPILLRGVDESWQAMRPEIKVVAGRAFTPGKHEVLVGRALLGEFAGLNLGDEVTDYNSTFTVVGHFDAQGGMAESEMLMDLATVSSAYRRGNAVNAVRVKLSRPDAAAAVQARIDEDPNAGVYLLMEEDLHAEHIAQRKGMIEAFAAWIVGIMLLGAIVAALSTMYAAVAHRTREIATLRALGFANMPIVVALLIEAMLLALLGAAIGTGTVYALFNGMEASTRGGMNVTLVFAFQLTTKIVLGSVALSLGLGFVGGLMATVRASRIPVTQALVRR